MRREKKREQTIIAWSKLYSPIVLFVTGAPYNRRQFQLTCMVECDPVCSLSWLHNGSPVKLQQEEDQNEQEEQDGDDQGRRFRVRNSVWPPSPMENRLLSVESTLEMDLIATNAVDPWPRDEVSEAVDDNSGHNYTCVASGNSVGQGVRSTTTYRVHYPPRNISVGMRFVHLIFCV